MKSLHTLLEGLEYEVLSGSLDTEITAMVYDSRKAVPGCLFLCVRGAAVDGHRFAKSAVEKGAAALIVEEEVDVPEEITVIKVADSRSALALLSCAWFDHPAEKLKVIGITGTKGKTTTTYLVRSILEHAGHTVGLVGTIETIIKDVRIPSENTTPESYMLQDYFSRMVENGCDCVVMEVSSQSYLMHRVDGFTFDYGIFTNIEPDHIGPAEHPTFENYLECKKMLLKQSRIGIVNRDDEHFEQIIDGVNCKLETYGFDSTADLYATDEKMVSKPGYLGISFTVNGLMNFPVEIDIPGRFSIYNALTAIAICRHFEVDIPVIQAALKAAQVKGRVEMIKVSDDFTLMIDYAHNAMALESLLTTLKEYHPHRLVTMFGCGGNRSRLRRFDMGEVSGRLSDLTVITSDNPRDEEPQEIMDDIVTGISRTSGKYIQIVNRKDAIRYCIRNGEPGDIIILAGKGHEDYQIIKGKKYPMDERVLIAEILAEPEMKK